MFSSTLSFYIALFLLSRILFLPTVPLIYCFERDGISETKYRHIADFLFRLLKWISLQLNNFGSTRFIDIGIWWCQSRQRFFYCFAVKQKSMQLNHVSCNSSRKLCFLHLYWRAIISHHQPRPIPLQLSSSQIVELSNIILQVFCNWCCPEDIKWRRGSSSYAHSFFLAHPFQPAHQ